MKHADRAVVEAFASLKGNHHFDTIIRWLVESRQESEGRLIAARDPVDVHREQGAVKELQEIADLEHTCLQRIADIKRQQQ